jgi:hypothetical protein
MHIRRSGKDPVSKTTRDPNYTSSMEIEGHPTQDLMEELERRGALRVAGSTAGPNADALRFLGERLGDASGIWLFLSRQAFMTGFDDESTLT